MRCKECDYPLWNLTTRICPECGTPFKPSEFAFKAYKVEFHCPECAQTYFGTNADGHLEPKEFECVKCGEHISMDEMVLRPAPGLSESQTEAYTMPWLDRKRRGFIKAWFTTTLHAMVFPTTLMKGVPANASVGEAWLFALLSMVVFIAVGVAAPVAGIGLISMLGRFDPMFFIMASIAIPAGVLSTAISILLWGAMAHGLLRVTGSCASTIGRTYQAMCYSIGPMAISSIPCLGWYCLSYAGWIWWLVCAILMLTVAQGVSGVRATLAGIAFPVLGFVAMVTLIFVPMIFAAQMAPVTGATQMWQVQQAQSETQMLVNAMHQWYLQHPNKSLEHGLQLMVDGPRVPWDYIGGTSETYLTDVPVADTTLERMQFLGPNRQRQVVDRAIQQMPDNVVAHRVGDFVFTHHGIDFDTAVSDLWLVVYAPDSDANTLSAQESTITVGLMSRKVIEVDLDDVPDPLGQQNELRRQAGLPPLVDPRTITHDQPQRN